MTENVRKLVGVVVVAVLVVVGVVTTSGGDDVDFTRNAAFLRMPKAQQARLAPAFLEQAAPKSLDTGPINKINNEVGPIGKGAKASIRSATGIHGLSTGKASVLEGTGVDGKGGTSSFRAGTAVNGKTGFIIVSNDGTDALSGRKASFRAGGGMNGVADRILECANSFEEIKVTVAGAGSGTVVNSLKNVMITSYTADAGDIASGYNCQDLQGNNLLPDDTTFPDVDQREAELLATCMDSKVGDVFLKTHIESSATDCIATVLPTALPDRAKQLGTYWQTQQQITAAEGESG